MGEHGRLRFLHALTFYQHGASNTTHFPKPPQFLVLSWEMPAQGSDSKGSISLASARDWDHTGLPFWMRGTSHFHCLGSAPATGSSQNPP